MFARPLRPLLLLALLGACGGTEPTYDPARAIEIMDSSAEKYVQLVLAVGLHDPDYVDAYYGPEEWRIIARGTRPGLKKIQTEAEDLLRALGDIDVSSLEEIVQLRHGFLTRQISSLIARTQMLEGQAFSFDEESESLYDATSPHLPESHFEETLADLDRMLPGAGPLAERLEAFRGEFTIPPDRLDAVFSAAIEECRQRTRAHIDLPEDEDFRVEYVTGKSWSAYNWYQGELKSLIQVNTDLPIRIDRAIDLAAHEGYPGHHVYNALLEDRLVQGRGWVEFMVYPLFSPMSLIAEGSANFGIEVAFPASERVQFERDVLYPLAGLDPARAEGYSNVESAAARLSYAGNEAARRYLDGEISADAAADWLTRFALMSPERARQRVDFIDKYRSYVINYNLGQDLVREYIESRGGTSDNSGARWREFETLISSPRLPSGLR